MGKAPCSGHYPFVPQAPWKVGCYLWERPHGQAITPVYLRLQIEFPGHNALTARPSFVIIVPHLTMEI
jgi:hypothetical protein